MLSRSYFFSSVILGKYINKFMKCGKKEKFERKILKIFLLITKKLKLSPVNLIYNIIELQKPTLLSKTIYKRRQSVQIAILHSNALRKYTKALHWIKEVTFGFTSRSKLKNELRNLRAEVRLLEKRLKNKKYDLTDSEKNILSKVKIVEKQSTKIKHLGFENKFYFWLHSASTDFKKTRGWVLKDTYHKLLLENRVYSHFRWSRN